MHFSLFAFVLPFALAATSLSEADLAPNANSVVNHRSLKQFDSSNINHKRLIKRHRRKRRQTSSCDATSDDSDLAADNTPNVVAAVAASPSHSTKHPSAASASGASSSGSESSTTPSNDSSTDDSNAGSAVSSSTTDDADSSNNSTAATTSSSSSVSGFSGTNTGIGSWFRTDNSGDSTNGRSWCQTNYQDSWLGFAPDVSTMISSMGGDAKKAGAAYCGLEAIATNPSNGKSATIYIVDGFDPKWVRTAGSIDLTLAAFKALYGSETSNKDVVIQNLQWKLTGNRNSAYAYNA